MVPNLSRSQQRGLVLVSALILGALFFFHWLENRKTESFENATSLQAGAQIIELDGAVQRPGLYTYDRPPTISRVLEDSGGPTRDGRLSPSQAGEVLTGETRLTITASAPKTLSLEKGPLSVRTLWLLGRPIPVNRATAEELDAVPGLGPGLARRIVEHRENLGSFAAIEELQQVSGIGEKTLEKLRPYLSAP